MVMKTPEVIDIAGDDSDVEIKNVTSMTTEEKKDRDKALTRRLCKKRKTPCKSI